MKTKIDEKVKESMRSQDKIALSLYRELKSAIAVFETSGKTQVEATTSDVMRIINNVLKQHQESKEAYEKGNRTESVKDEEKYISLLNELLPPVLTDDKIEEELTKLFETISPNKQNMGTLIKKLKETIESKGFMVDGSNIANLVKSKIS